MITKDGKDSQLIVFKPSWRKSFRRITRVTQANIKKQSFENGQLILDENTFRSVFDGQFISKLSLAKFKNGQAYAKETVQWFKNESQKEISTYKFVDNKWGLSSKKTVNISEVANEGSNKCYKNLFEAPSRSSKRQVQSISGLYIAGELDPSKYYYHTKYGLRIQKDTCSKEELKALDEALTRFYNVQLPCFSELRPNLTSEIIENLAANKNIISCKRDIEDRKQGKFSGKDQIGNRACRAYTYTQLDGKIHFCGDGGKLLEGSAVDNASTIFHEVLHHHLGSHADHIGDHDKNFYEADAVYSCAAICSGYKDAKAKDVPGSLLKNRLTQKSCETCVEAERENNSFFGLFDLKPSKGDLAQKSQKACSNSKLLLRRNKCKDKLSEALCERASVIDNFDNPLFLKCLGVERPIAKLCLNSRLQTGSTAVTCIAKSMEEGSFSACEKFDYKNKGDKLELCMKRADKYKVKALNCFFQSRQLDVLGHGDYDSCRRLFKAFDGKTTCDEIKNLEHIFKSQKHQECVKDNLTQPQDTRRGNLKSFGVVKKCNALYGGPEAFRPKNEFNKDFRGRSYDPDKWSH